MHDQPLKRILVVDDDPDVLTVVTMALADLASYVVQPCASAREAIEQAPSFEPDLILLDVMMPDIDGFGALRALRDLPATADTAIVFMTALVRRHEMTQYQEVGCLGVVPKPFDPLQLPGILEGMWGQRRARLVEAHRRQFEELRLAYVGQLPEKIEAMREHAASLVKDGWDREMVQSLHDLAHRIAGSSGLYRLYALSRAAGALEDILKRLLAGPVWPPAASRQELAMMVKAVERTARRESRLAQAPETGPGASA
jgi:two-component system, OmpR family, response regulator